MAELIHKLRQLQGLSEEVHLFCPRTGADDGGYYFDEDLQSQVDDEDQAARERRHRRVKKAEERKALVLDCLQILAFDGPDAAEFKRWLEGRLNAQMTSCDVCIRVYHRAKGELRQKLEEEYDDEDVIRFLEMINDRDIRRITKGLGRATLELLEIPPEQRGINALDPVGLYAIFETLSCEAFLRSDRLLSQHFDKPFQLVQTNKRLRLSSYTPAMTSFLFSTEEHRYLWAFTTWSRFKRNLTSAEFDWTVRAPLLDAMMRVQITALDVDFLPLFWSGTRMIVSKLDKDLITHSLRAMDIDICKLALEHLHIDSEAFKDLMGTFQLLLEKSPTDFWDAMGAISPVTVAEQVFSSPALERMLLHADGEDSSGSEALEDVFAWIDPFLASIKPANQTPACRALTHQLMDLLQTDRFSRTARSYCYKLGLHVLAQTLRNLNMGRSISQFVGAATVADLLDVITHHIHAILTDARAFGEQSLGSETSQLALDVIQLALSLDCLSLAVDRELIARGKPLQHEKGTQSQVLWQTIIKSVKPGDVALSTRILAGARGLVGLENFITKSGTQLPKDMRKYNDVYDGLSRFVTDVLERLNDFPANDLIRMFEALDSASAVLATLFSSNRGTRQATIDLLKVVSSQNGRKEALGQVVTSFYQNALSSLSTTIRHVANRKVFAPASSMIKICTDVVDILCDSQDGLLRSRTLTAEDSKLTENFWQSLWQALTVIFDMTESWSNAGHDKAQMMDFCRDTMQFADKLFKQYGIFASALNATDITQGEKDNRAETGHRLLQYPRTTMSGMVKWLRLRDEYLSSKSVSLISNLLVRMHDVSIEIPEETLKFVEDIITGKIRAKLSGPQLAELRRALETHLGHPIARPEEPSKPAKQGSLSSWVTTGPAAQQFRDQSATSSDAESDEVSISRIILDSSRTADANKARLAAAKAKAAQVQKKAAPKNVIDATEFKRQRAAELEAKKKRDALALAKAKRSALGLEQTAEAGSGLQGLGVLGKDHAPKGTGMMVSSDEESNHDEEDALDAELFGVKKPAKRDIALGDARLQAFKKLPQGPVKKQRQARSAKDMRARLAPDLTSLHKTLLSWDYFHEGDFPPNSRPDMYSAVPATFRTSLDYQNVFQPLLTLEAWQGFVKAREENSFKPYEIKVVNRSSVDAFVEVSTTMTHADNKDISLTEGDVVLMSRSQSPATTPDQPHCLARVLRITRKKAFLEILYRVMPGNPLIPSLAPQATVHGVKIQSLTPLEREYGALLGLQYYDLCDEVIKAKPSPLLKYTDQQLEPIISNYSVNKAQAKAVKSAIDNDAFTLIQGPPGSGKTKTIVAIVGAILTDSLRDKGTIIERPRSAAGVPTPHLRGAALLPPKKLLVCAPSNAAVDELVMRFKEGVKTTTGQHKKISVVRLGHSDAINANVSDVTLDELVNARLNTGPGQGSNQREETQKLMKEHQAVSEKLREARDKLDQSDVKGSEAAKLKDEFDALKRRKAQLSNQIDNARDNENTMNRQADLNRRRAQQTILDEAHVICATLSGSGHEMFQSFNIEFETVIVDEAAQCVEMSALIPLKYGCAKCILVGDPKQLPPTVFSKEAARFQYEQSLFVRMQGNHPDDVHLLDTQYRMHPEISAFPSQTFYDGRLLDGDDMATLRQRPWHAAALLGPYRFFDVQGQHQAAPKGHSLINLAEIDVALQLFERLTTDFNDNEFRGKIGIITPYKSQLRELKNRFSRKYGQAIFETVEFNTTDAYQGRESEIIIFSCVRASPAGGIGFLQDIRRMNVGLTRAKSSLWVLGNSQSLMRGDFWRQLIEDARRRDRVTEGSVLQLLQRPSAQARSNKPTAPPKKASTGPGSVREEARSRSSSSSANERIKMKPEPGFAQSSERDNGRNVKQEMPRPFIKPEEVDGSPYPAANGQLMKNEDVEMKDAYSDKESVSSINKAGKKPLPNGNSKETLVPKEKTPAGTTPSTKTTAPQPSYEAPRPRMIPVKRKKEVDPFIKPNRPKKPKPN